MMNRIYSVYAVDDYMVEVQFYNGDTKQYDVRQLFSVFPKFKVFEVEKKLFQNVKVAAGGHGIFWNDELDLNHLLAYRLLLARNQAGMTQKELSEKTGIYQADISKIERGIGNPSIATLQRLANAMDMVLEIKFVSGKTEKGE